MMIQTRHNDKNRKKNQHVEIKDERKQVFDNVHGCSMVDPFILTTPAFKIIEDFKSAIQEGPTSICDMLEIEFRKNGIKLNALKYLVFKLVFVINFQLVNQIGYAEVVTNLC